MREDWNDLAILFDDLLPFILIQKILNTQIEPSPASTASHPSNDFLSGINRWL